MPSTRQPVNSCDELGLEKFHCAAGSRSRQSAHHVGNAGELERKIRRPGDESSEPSGPPREVPRADTEGNSAKVAGIIQTPSVKPATDFTVQGSWRKAMERSGHRPFPHEGEGISEPCHSFPNTPTVRPLAQ